MSVIGNLSRNLLDKRILSVILPDNASLPIALSIFLPDKFSCGITPSFGVGEGYHLPCRILLRDGRFLKLHFGRFPTKASIFKFFFGHNSFVLSFDNCAMPNCWTVQLMFLFFCGQFSLYYCFGAAYSSTFGYNKLDTLPNCLTCKRSRLSNLVRLMCSGCGVPPHAKRQCCSCDASIVISSQMCDQLNFLDTVWNIGYIR